LIGDPARLRQVLINLTGNAIKFTQRGGITVEVDTEESNAAEPNAQHVELHFQVRDRGIGIPTEKQAVIFDAFTQAEWDGIALSLQLRLRTWEPTVWSPPPTRLRLSRAKRLNIRVKD
jgi:signal transduction histidine kinase